MLCTMNRKRRFEERCWAGAVAVVAAGLVLDPGVQAQEPGSVTIDVSECVELERAEERLACFEREVEARRQPAPAADRTSPAATPAPVAETRRARRDRKESPGREIVAKVADLRETVPNTWTITLDNGQIWRQAPPKPYALRPGMEVRLYPTNWGTAYRLTVAELRGFIQVDRVR
jgi:hypothetical protein